MSKVREISGRVVVVTGAGRGIGRAIALELARSGARLALADLDVTSAETVAAEIGRLGQHARAYALDVTKREDVAAIASRIERELGEIDIWINNAGIMCLGPFLDQPVSQDRSQMRVNFDGVVNGLRAVLPLMLKRRRGHIINIASAAGRVGTPYAAIYSATKHAVIGLTEAVRAEHLESGVDFTYVMPGVVRTELIAGAGEPAWPPVAAPEDVAKAVADAIQTKQVDVYVPKVARISVILPAFLPRFALEWIGKKLKIDQMFANVDEKARAAYAKRITRSDDDDEPQGPFGPTPRASA
jgi:short-subunit dehydrogenase